MDCAGDLLNKKSNMEIIKIEEEMDDAMNRLNEIRDLLLVEVENKLE